MLISSINLQSFRAPQSPADHSYLFELGWKEFTNSAEPIETNEAIINRETNEQLLIQSGKNTQIFERLKHKIGIAPGQIFSTQGNQFQNYFRITFGLPWSDRVEEGLKTLGDLVKKF